MNNQRGHTSNALTRTATVAKYCSYRSFRVTVTFVDQYVIQWLNTGMNPPVVAKTSKTDIKKMEV